MEFPAYAALRLKQVFPDVKVICRAHGCDLYWERHSLPYLPLRKYIADHVNAAYFISEQGRDYFMRKNHLNNDGSLKVAKLGVKGAKVMAKASSDGVFRILSCSHAVRVKRVDLIIKALACIYDFDVEWTHIGDGTDLPDLKAKASRLFQERANIKHEFKGFLPNAMVYEYYQNNCVDVLINLSSSEGLPVSMMEAFAFGVPVLATAVGGVPEIVNESNGALLPPEVTPQEAASAIVKMRGLSSEEMRTLKNNAYETWRKSYDADANYESFAQNVLDVSGLAPRRPPFAATGVAEGSPQPLTPT
jgi:glycosyltransferase involved in cell wall biosynthesis